MNLPAEPAGCQSFGTKEFLFLLQPGLRLQSRAPDYLRSVHPCVTRAPTLNSLLTRREEFTRTNFLNLTDSAIPADWNLSVCDDVTEDDHHVVTVHFAKQSAVFTLTPSRSACSRPPQLG